MLVLLKSIYLCLFMSTIGIALAKEGVKWSTNAAVASSYSTGLLRRFRRQSSNVEESYSFDGNLVMIAVDTHNTARRTVEPSSANMREMSWDDQLADLALDYSQQCEFEHNPNRYHDRFGNSVGENLFISRGLTWDADYVENGLKEWDNERYDYDYESHTCTPNKQCGHYTQMVAASSFKVGCGASLCSSVVVNGRIWTDATLLVCNYGPAGNIVGELPYISGIPCDKCEDNSDSCSNGLCFNPSRLEVPVSASWLEWGSWGDCSTSCGYEGRRYRSRLCDTFVLSDCDGFSRQVDPYCAHQDCPANEEIEATTTLSTTPQTTTTQRTNPQPTIPQTTTTRSTTVRVTDPSTSVSSGENECSEWTSWGSCSEPCGRGEQRRTQTCTRVEGRLTYTQTRTQIQSCQNTCNNGDSEGFGEWSSWSQCTNLCGSGLRYRLRDCEAPPCSGSSFELSECQSFELC